MSQHVYAHVVKHAFEHSKTMPRVGEGKSPAAAFCVGFLFGPIGAGIYLKSMGDFVILLALVIGGSIMTAGIAAPLMWVLCGVWAAVRVSNSNKAAESAEYLPANHSRVVHAELVEPEPATSLAQRPAYQRA